MHKTVTTLSILLLALFFFGCSEPLSTREKGAAIGTFTGAGIGAAVGLLGGALIGDQMQSRQKQEQDLQQQMATQQAEIDRANREIQQLKAQQAQ